MWSFLSHITNIICISSYDANRIQAIVVSHIHVVYAIFQLYHVYYIPYFRFPFIQHVNEEVQYPTVHTRTRFVLRKTRAPRGTDRSPEYNEHFCYKLDSRVKIIAMNSVCCCSFPVWRRSFLKKGTPSPGDLFCLALDPPLGRYGQNILMHVPGHEHFIPNKFRKHPFSGSVVKADFVFPYIYMH